MSLKNNIPRKKKDSKRNATHFTVVEAYKMIRTNILFLLSQTDKKSFIVSSPNESEGKSTTSINTAIAFSQLGCRVLLIDTDMRKASVHKKLHIQNENGLSSVLAGFSTLSESIHQINPNFDVMTAGSTPPNPSELLASPQMEKIMDELCKTYDYIILDAPPINVVSDALIVAPLTAGITFVVRDYKTTHTEIKKALSSLELAGIKPFGMILNDTKNSFKKGYRYRSCNYYY